MGEKLVLSMLLQEEIGSKKVIAYNKIKGGYKLILRCGLCGEEVEVKLMEPGITCIKCRNDEKRDYIITLWEDGKLLDYYIIDRKIYRSYMENAPAKDKDSVYKYIIENIKSDKGGIK